MPLPPIPKDRPVLIAGPTASGKSVLAMQIAKEHGGVIVNADASQVYTCWRVVTARPSLADEAALPHRLYGHVPYDAPYSAGHWLREVAPIVHGADRPIIVGGTGLYFSALTEGLADVPNTPTDIRKMADDLPLDALLADLDLTTRNRIDTANRARVQRAWEVLRHTGRGLATWQEETPAPLVPQDNAVCIVMHSPKEWLNARIVARFDAMIAQGALEEVGLMSAAYDPSLPAFRAIGVPELHAHVKGDISLDEARMQACIATRQFAKRQRTWFRKRMRDWAVFDPTNDRIGR